MTALEVTPGAIALLVSLAAAILGAWGVSTGSGGSRAIGCAGLLLGFAILVSCTLWIATVSLVGAYT